MATDDTPSVHGADAWTDAAVLTLLATDPAAAMDALYHRLARPLYSLAYHVLCNPADAEEVMHDALLRFWTLYAHFDPQRGSIATWLKTITYRLALDRLRAERRQPPRVSGCWDPATPRPEQPDPGPLPETLMLIAEQDTHIQRCVQTLAPIYGDALIAAFWHDLSHTEIATQRCVPLGTVKARLRRALAAVKRQLAHPAAD